MANDILDIIEQIENIAQIEQQIGKKLEPVSLDSIMGWGNTGFAQDDAGQVVGLNLDQTGIKDISFLSGLRGLTHLSLNSNQISDLTPLKELTNLKVLNLYNNQISDLTPLSALNNLTTLDLQSNQISDLTPLSNLTNLEELYLNSNQIADLTPLKELKNLKSIDISNNLIEKLPPEIFEWWPRMEIKWENGWTSGLNLLDNPLKDPPVEIVKKGTGAVKNYFDETKRDSVLFLESKLLLVGSGDVGKTTLMKKLKNNAFEVVPGKEDTTRGIDIQKWQLDCTFPNGHTHEVKIHFWDFGGQDILHATHQFFLTKRSLYLFTWDPRKEEETQSFDYWLNAVKLFGSGSPLIMAMNKADIRTKHIDEASFKEKFPNIVQFLQVSCVTGQHIRELTETIRSSLSGMTHLLDKLPKRWMEIRSALDHMELNYITLIRYFSVCSAHEMSQEKSLFLSDYLHDLGIILHFRSDPVLADTVILKPEWATGAVYALIDSLEIQNNKGQFNRSNLTRYWDNELYPTGLHPKLLRLMEKFELCFNIVGTDDYILPELLPSERPALDTELYRSPANLHLQYSYDFMPAGIITRFISRLHYLIRDHHYWKNGVELAFSGSFALVVSDAAQKRIRVSVSGPDKIQLIGIIRSHFDHIHQTLNMKKEEHLFEEVPCNCSKCAGSDKPYFYRYNLLQKMREKNRNAFCEKSGEDVSVPGLIQGLLPPVQTKNLFDTIITMLAKLQGIKKTLQPNENSRNTVVSLLLETSGFRTKDQTLWGTSESGLDLGELDILVQDNTNRPVSIIEAMNLDSLNKTGIHRHVKKLLKNYDCSGLKENYMVVYAEAKDFEKLCEKYGAHLAKIDYENYPLKGEIEETKTGFNKIAAYSTRHKCNKGETVLNHVLVEM